MSKVNSDSASVAGNVEDRPLARAVKQASDQALANHQIEVRDKIIEYHRDIYSSAAAYDNGVILAGYVAFFALWSGVNGDISALCRLTTVFLMGLSLLLYMTWHILQMLTRQKYEWKYAEAFDHANDPERFNREWNENSEMMTIAMARLMRFWPWIFVPCVVTGFSGGGVLTYNALALILGWPQLKG